MTKLLVIILAGLIGAGVIYELTWPSTQIIQIIPEQKMIECLGNGGEYEVKNWSYHDNINDYRMTCTIPEKEIWQFNY